MPNTIIINNTYAGNYGADKDNLPHEVINFFKSDKNDEFYVYITPYGTLNNEITKKEIKGILFVRSVGDGLVEVLAKAELGKSGEFYTQGISLYGENKSDPSKSHSIKSIRVKGEQPKESKSTAIIEKKKKELQELNKTIKYGGTSLKEIHKANQKDNEILVSLKVEKICLPKKTFYLSYKSTNATESNDDIYLIKEETEEKGKKINNQKMIAYYYEDNEQTKDSYNKLSAIIEDKDKKLWKDSSETPTYNSQNILDEFKIYDNFFKVTRQQDNEVMFSNMFYYYFSEYPELTQKFINDVLNTKLDKQIELSSVAHVEREKERIDLRIIDDNNYIIIENKIKSCINGTKKNKESDDFEKENDKYISQLSVYYKKAEEKNKLDNKKREIYGFIFAPNYSVIDDEYKEKFLHGEKYKIIHYSEIYEFFKNISNELSEEPKYLSDFTKALKKHTEKTDDEFRKILMLRLKSRIEQNN